MNFLGNLIMSIRRKLQGKAKTVIGSVGNRGKRLTILKSRQTSAPVEIAAQELPKESPRPKPKPPKRSQKQRRRKQPRENKCLKNHES